MRYWLADPQQRKYYRINQNREAALQRDLKAASKVGKRRRTAKRKTKSRISSMESP